MVKFDHENSLKRNSRLAPLWSQVLYLVTGPLWSKKGHFWPFLINFDQNFSFFGKIIRVSLDFCDFFSQKICDTRKRIQKKWKFFTFFSIFFVHFRWNGCTFRDMGAWKALERSVLALLGRSRAFGPGSTHGPHRRTCWAFLNKINNFNSGVFFLRPPARRPQTPKI